MPEIGTHLFENIAHIFTPRMHNQIWTSSQQSKIAIFELVGIDYYGTHTKVEFIAM